MQEVLDDVSRNYKDKPVGEIKSVLQRRRAAGGKRSSLTNPHLTAYAKAISDGRVVVGMGSSS